MFIVEIAQGELLTVVCCSISIHRFWGPASLEQKSS